MVYYYCYYHCCYYYHIHQFNFSITSTSTLHTAYNMMDAIDVWGEKKIRWGKTAHSSRNTMCALASSRREICCFYFMCMRCVCVMFVWVLCLCGGSSLSFIDGHQRWMNDDPLIKYFPSGTSFPNFNCQQFYDLWFALLLNLLRTNVLTI